MSTDATPPARPFRKGDEVRIRPEWQDAGDETLKFFCVDDEEKGRVIITADLGLTFNGQSTVETTMIEHAK